MSKLSANHRVLQAGGALLVILVLAGLFAWRPLADFGARTLLELLGADQIRLAVAHASPWRVELRDVAFRVRTRTYAAGGVVFERAHWWTPSLGAVRIVDARLTLNIDGSDTNPWEWASYRNGITRVHPLNLPLEAIAANGELIVQAAGVPDKAIAVKLTGQRVGPELWSGRLHAAGDGVEVTTDLTVDPATNAMGCKLAEFALDVEAWQEFLQRLVLLPGGAARLAGRLTGRAEGRLQGKKLSVGGTLRLRRGRYQNGARPVAAEGIEFDLELVESDKFRAKPGALRVAELRTGRLVVRDIAAGFLLENAGRITVSGATLSALGGRGSVEPFSYSFAQRGELDLVVLVEKLDLPEVLALAPDVRAKAAGRLDGRLPLRIDEGGARLGQGWLALTPGIPAELEFTSPGLLTAGKGTDTPGYMVLQKVEAGLVLVKLDKLRVDLHLPDAPRGCSAQLHLAGRTAGTDEAVVAFDVSVNGPVERLVDVGFDSHGGR